GGHRLRDRAQHDAAECDRVGGRHVRLHAADRDGAVGRHGADPVGRLHADRRPNYTTASKTVSINVLKATPTITWPTPADIVYGTALSATQLNASANVAGSFVYAPTLGGVLNAGTAQTLSVAFTPTDAANYTTASKAVSINVLKATPVLTWATPADIVYGTALS